MPAGSMAAPTGCCSMPQPRRCPAETDRGSAGRCWWPIIAPCPGGWQAGSTPITCAKHWPRPRPRWSMSPRAWKARRESKIWTRSPAFAKRFATMTNTATQLNSYRNQPDAQGHFGQFGGRYVAETLMPLVLDLEKHYRAAKADPAFQAQFDDLLEHYVGRPSPLYYADRLTEERRKAAPEGKGAQVWFKRDELNHTGAHKINNCIGQILLAMRMGKTRIIAETGAGQHGVATATVCARFGLPCVVYMGKVDTERQQPNVFRMNLLGAEVVPVTSGSATLKDAMNEALRDWVTNVEDTYYLIGSAAGPHPYPMMVRDFQSVMGREIRDQILEAEGRLPDAVVACVGGGSNAIGTFHPFLNDEGVKIFGVEAAGEGMGTDRHAAAIHGGRPGAPHR